VAGYDGAEPGDSPAAEGSMLAGPAGLLADPAAAYRVPEQSPGAWVPFAGAAVPPPAVPAAPSPGRRRMAALLRSAGVRGMTVRGIAEQLAADGGVIAHDVIHSWLSEEQAAGRVEDASYGRWKWRAG
jgi:hypothetical protein